MKCAVHAEVDATGYCRNCGKPLCPECTRDVRGALYCEPCLAGLISTPPPPAASTPSAGHNPAVAAALGFIPGLGAVYNGEYIKALIQVLVFAGLIGAQSADISAANHAFLGILLGCFYFYMPIEAYRTAKAREATPPNVGAATTLEGRRPVGAIILIAIGVLLLLENFGIFEWEWLGKTWPIGLILLGGWLLFQRMKRQS